VYVAMLQGAKTLGKKNIEALSGGVCVVDAPGHVGSCYR
jgi:hypothetical protein